MQSTNDAKTRITQRVARYRRDPQPVEHEELVQLIDEFYGRNAAEFFDQEGRLPVTGKVGLGGFPWPMEPQEKTMYAMHVVGWSAVLVLTLTWALSRIVDTRIAALIGVGVGFALWYGATPLISRLFKPKDLTERQRLVEVFDEIIERNAAAAAERAQRARAERQFKRIADDLNDSSRTTD